MKFCDRASAIRYRMTKFSSKVWSLGGQAAGSSVFSSPRFEAIPPRRRRHPSSPFKDPTLSSASHSFSRLLTMVEDNPVNNVPDNANKKKRRAKRSRKKKDPSKTVCKFYLEGKVSVLDYACLYCTLF